MRFFLSFLSTSSLLIVLFLCVLRDSAVNLSYNSFLTAFLVISRLKP